MSIITVCGGVNNKELEITEKIANNTGYTLFTKEMVVAESAKKYNIMEENLLEKLENSPSMWQQFTDEYGRYLIYVRSTLLSIAKQDNIVYDGEAGQLFLRGIPHVLKLRIEASHDHKVKSILSQFNNDYQQASDYIKNIERQKKQWIKKVYNIDWTDPVLYDLWINSDTVSIDSISKLVSTTLEQDDFRITENSMKKLNNLSLECEIKAALVADDKIWSSQDISISTNNGVVTLRGTIKTEELLNLIIDTTQKVKGVVECISDIILLSDSITR